MTESATEAGSGPTLMPGETPGRRELDEWLKHNKPFLLNGTAGYLYQGTEPAAFVKLRTRPTVPEAEANVRPPATAGDPLLPDHSVLARIRKENRDITARNEENTVQLAALTLDVKTELAKELAKLLKPHAPSMLAALQAKHQIVNAPTGLADGIAMLKEIEVQPEIKRDQAAIELRFRELTSPDFSMPDDATESSFIELRNEFDLRVHPFVKTPLSNNLIVDMFVGWIPLGMASIRDNLVDWIKEKSYETNIGEVTKRIRDKLGDQELQRQRVVTMSAVAAAPVGSAAAARNAPRSRGGRNGGGLSSCTARMERSRARARTWRPHSVAIV